MNAISKKLPFIAACGVGMGLLFARLGYFLKHRRNEETIWLMRCLPYKNACVGDVEQLPVQKAKLDRQAWIRAARTGVSSLATSIRSLADQLGEKRVAKQKLGKVFDQKS